MERWLADGLVVSEGGWYVGRPVIVTENDYSLGLFNGDTGVVIAAAGRRDSRLPSGGELKS